MRKPTTRSVLGALALGACSVGSGEGETVRGGGQTVPLDRLSDELAGAVCRNIGDCCAAEDIAYDNSTCTTVLSQLYRASLTSFIDENQYDANDGARCVEHVGASFGACDPAQARTGPCENIFDPSSARAGLSEPCGFSCERFGEVTGCWENGAHPGECYAEDGLYCSDGQCAALAARGADCTATFACDNGYCDQGTCSAQLNQGQSCGFDDSACSDGLFCSSTDGCQPQGGAGAACFRDVECLSDECQSDATCADPNGGISESDRTFFLVACGG